MRSYHCRRCADGVSDLELTDAELEERYPAEERFSMGVYAGMLCDACWAADGRNHDRQFDPMDAGEAYGPEDY